MSGMQSSTPLLREEALRFRAAARHGLPGLWQPPALSLFVLVCMSLLLTLVLFAATARFKTTVSVSGVLVPEQGMVQISPLHGGVLGALHVREGEQVSPGQVIAELSREQFGQDGRGSRLLDEHFHESRLTQLDHDLKLYQQHSRGERQRLSLLITNLQEEQSGLLEELHLLQQRLDLSATTQATLGALLDRSLISEAEYQQQRTALLSLQQQRLQLRQLMAERRRQQQDAELRLQLLAVEAAQRHSEFIARREEWQHSRQGLLREALSSVVSPVAGMVAALSVSAGDVVRNGQVVAHVMKPDDTVEALLFLPTAAAGQIAVGQPVILQYEAFPLQTHGVHEGEVLSISRSAIDPRQHHLPQVQLQQPVYLLRARLPAQAIADAGAGGVQRSLLPGMAVQAEIVTAEMTILAYLLAPITRLLRK